jgi:hypothetical protein
MACCRRRSVGRPRDADGGRLSRGPRVRSAQPALNALAVVAAFSCRCRSPPSPTPPSSSRSRPRSRF